MKRFIKIFIVSAMLILSIGCFASTASAATKTSVVAMKKGTTATIKKTSKVTTSKKAVATAKKKSSTKYLITAKKAGKTTLKVYNKNGKLSQKIYLLVYTNKTMKYNTNAVTLAKGSTKTVKATVPSGCTVKYSSSNKNIAKVNSKGKITAVAKGTATIKAKVYYKNTKVKTFKKNVTVKAASSSSGSSNVSVSYDDSDLTMAIGDSKKVKATVPSNYTVKYNTTRSSVATVSSSGKITAVDAGTARIYAVVYDENNKRYDSFNKLIIVVDPVMDYPTLSLLVGNSETLTANVRLGTYTSKATYKWSVDNSKIVSLSDASSSTINVTAKAAGTATITCLVNDTIKITSKVTVNQEVYSGYDYSIYLVGAKADQLYTGCNYCIYVKTNNPDLSGFEFWISTIYGQVTAVSPSPKWSDIEYINYNSQGWSTVEGGYVNCISTKLGAGAASLELSVKETGKYGTKKTMASATIDFIDGEKAEEEWIESVLSKCTNDNMDSFEKMDAVRSYLVSDEAGFTYDTNIDGYLVNLTTEADPYFVTKKWDSYISPGALVKFAEKIGGFDYIHNCYDDENWSTHFYCKVGIGDDIRWYAVCPSSNTGEIDHIDYIDFNSTKNLTKIG